MNALYELRQVRSSLSEIKDTVQRNMDELEVVIRHLEDKVCEIKAEEDDQC